ncbi:MAG TPA: AAA family ATPase [Polyangiaceae bacterium]|nr:AAA family ATPase [Polyangiaceae bacterium]
MTAPPVDNPDPLAAAVQGADVLHEAKPPPAIVELWKRAADVRAFDANNRPPARDWLLEREPENDEERDEAKKWGGEGARVGVLPLGKVGLLASAGGCGKTMLLCQLAISVATGLPWLGRRGGRQGWHVAPRALGKSLLLLGEEDEDEARRRLYNAADTMGLNDEERARAADLIHFVPLAGCPSALTERDERGAVRSSPAMHALRDRLEALAKADGEPWRLVVVDPLARFADSEAEADNAAATRFIQEAETLARRIGEHKSGPAVLVAHHTAKVARREGDASGNAIRGASGLVDGARWAATLESLPEPDVGPDGPGGRRLGFSGARLALVKSNYSATAPPLWLRRAGNGALVEMTADERERFEAAMVETKNAEKNGARPKRPPPQGGNGKTPPTPPSPSHYEPRSALDEQRDTERENQTRRDLFE